MTRRGVGIEARLSSPHTRTLAQQRSDLHLIRCEELLRLSAVGPAVPG